jgi:hypothetical protein
MANFLTFLINLDADVHRDAEERGSTKSGSGAAKFQSGLSWAKNGRWGGSHDLNEALPTSDDLLKFDPGVSQGEPKSRQPTTVIYNEWYCQLITRYLLLNRNELGNWRRLVFTCTESQDDVIIIIRNNTWAGDGEAEDGWAEMY